MLKKYEIKIKHLTAKQQNIKPTKSPVHTVVPESLIKYKDLTIFKPSDQFPKKADPTGPFLCDPRIKLSKDEVKIL